MRPFSGKHRGLSLSLLFPLSWAAAVLSLIAVLLGRSAPVPPADPSPRQPAHPRSIGIDRSWLEGEPSHVPFLLDTESGGCTPCPVSDAWNVGQFRSSPWRDAQGRYHLIARAMEKTGDSYER